MGKTIRSDKSVYHFDSGWEVSIFDEWKQFKKLNSEPFHSKGCDLVALKGESLWLVEAKDYCYETAHPQPKPGELARAFAQKIVGTLHTLMVVAKWSSGENAEFAQRALRCTEIKICLAIEIPTHKRGKKNVAVALAGLRQEIAKVTQKFGVKKPVISNSLVNSGGVPWVRKQDPEFRHIRLEK